MIVRPSLKTGTLPAMAAGVSLLVLAGASLGCAYAACYGVADVPHARISTPVQPGPVAAVPAPAPRPVAGVTEHGRCAGTASARNRRAGCRAADLPAV